MNPPDVQRSGKPLADSAPRGPLKWVEVDLDALRSNIRWVRGRVPPGCRLMAVAKADAYGHGAVRVSRLAEAEGAACLGVLTVAEALELRRGGIRLPVVLLAPPLPGEAPEVARAGLEATVDSENLAAALARAARGRPGAARVAVHVDVDYGLRRWGVRPAAAKRFMERLSRRRGIRVAGLSTHIDYVPGKNAVEAEEKLRSFQRLASWARARFPGIACHAANSSILLDFPRWSMDMVRIGNLIYGVNPTKSGAPLADPWRFFARVISLRRVAKGAAIGYASEFIAPRAMTVAALPAGYSDGLTLEPAERFIGLGRSPQYWGLVAGRQAPFVGRCAISHVLVDVSATPGTRVGDPVQLPIRRTAASPRLPRVYIQAGTPRPAGGPGSSR